MEIKRKLATIQTIKEVAPIAGADRIELVSFVNNNWRCVMKKGEASPGDKVVYFEIDSVLPSDDERFKFMGNSKFRVKTAKFRGQISQGLALPVMQFQNEITIEDVENDGADVTEALRVEKYELPVSTNIGGDPVGAFPGFITKTDEERVQNYPAEHVKRILKSHLTATVKIDGTSATFFYRDGYFGVCSRNLEIKESETNALWQMARKYALKERMEQYGKNLAIQGEVAGPGIQKNRAKLDDISLFVFTIQDLDTNMRLLPDEMQDVLLDLDDIKTGKAVSIRTVPMIGEYEPGYFKSYEDLVEFSQGKTLVTDEVREGVVFRGTNEANRDISFKVINPKYLLKHDL